MRRLGAFLIPVALFLSALQVFGQRGGHGGGFSPGGGFHGGFHQPSFSGSRFAGPQAFGAAPRSFSGNLRGPDFSQRSFSGSYGGFGWGGGRRRPYRRNWGLVFAPPYGYGYGAYLDPNLVGYPFGFDYDYDDQGYGDQGYDDQQDGNYSPQQEPYPPEGPPAEGYAQPDPSEYAESQPADEYRPPYQGSSLMEQPASEEAVHAQPATMLIFNNGWPSMQVHNYVLTRTALYDLDGRTQRKIPLSEINVPATTKANRSAGVEFAPPTH